MKLIEGQLIHRRYRLDARLAQGGMGEVWKGYDIQLGRPVAIKALRGDLGVTQEAKLLRLRAEAHNSANLAHPNIAALFEYYEHDGIGFLVMEYVPSKSLSDLFHEQNGPMEPTRLLPILIQTARGLFVAHSHGVIHRDVKPANIMVVRFRRGENHRFRRLLLHQSGADHAGWHGRRHRAVHLPRAGARQTGHAAIRHLLAGRRRYEGLCGHSAFTGTTPVDIAAAHVNDPVPPLPDSIDVQLRQFVMSMLSKDPLDRPKDALTVSRTLSRIERRLLDQETAQMDETHHGDLAGACPAAYPAHRTRRR